MPNDCPICLAKGGTCPKCEREALLRFYAGRITQGRLARSLSQTRLAKQLGITPYRLRRYEDGDERPTETVITKIGEVLDFPRRFFSRPPFELSKPVCPKWGGTA